MADEQTGFDERFPSSEDIPSDEEIAKKKEELAKMASPEGLYGAGALPTVRKGKPLSLAEIQELTTRIGGTPDINKLPKGLGDAVVSDLAHSFVAGVKAPGETVESHTPKTTEDLLKPGFDMSSAYAVGANTLKELAKIGAFSTWETIKPTKRLLEHLESKPSEPQTDLASRFPTKEEELKPYTPQAPPSIDFTYPSTDKFEPGTVPPSANVPVVPQTGTQPQRGGKNIPPEVDAAIVRASKAFGLDPNMMRGIASIESGFRPQSNRNVDTQYKGLFQLGARGKDSEWARHGHGDIYNADDNAMAAAALMRDNIDRFKKVMGRDPSPTEVYLMHQQGLGFYTRGKMTNIKGNPYPGMRGPQSPESFEAGWGNELERRMGQASVVQGAPYLPTEKIAPFLSGQPMATTPVELTGGLTDTPAKAAQMAQLMQEKPLDQITGLAQSMNTAATKAAIRNDPRTVGTRRGVVPLTGQQPVQGQLPVRVPQRETLPIPGMTPQQPSFLQTVMNTPTVIGTAGVYMGMRPPTIEPPGLFDTIKAALGKAVTESNPTASAASPIAMLGKVYSNLGGQVKDYLAKTYDIPDLTDSDNWTPETGQKLIQMGNDGMRAAAQADRAVTEGFKTGLASRATIPVGMAAMALATGYGLTGSKTMEEWAQHLLVKTMPAISDWSKEQGVNNLPPDASKDLASAGAFVGRNIMPSWPLTLLSVGGEYAAPYVLSALEKHAPDLQRMGFIQPAQGHDLTNIGGEFKVQTLPDGQHVMAQTAGGPVVVPHQTMNALGWAGIATMGLLFGGPSAGRMINQLYRNYLPFNPARIVPGTQDKVLAISTVKDLLKSETLSTQQPTIDIYKRWYDAFTRDGRVAADPYAAQRVADNLHIFSASGQRNLISSAMENGEFRTPTLSFSVNHTMRALNDFGRENPDFSKYLKLQIQRDELTFANNAYTEAVTRGANATQLAAIAKRYPLRHIDEQGNAVTRADVVSEIQHMERANPQLSQGLVGYREYIDKTKEFVTDGRYRPELPNKLADSTLNMPNTPIFNANTAPHDLWRTIRSGTADPLFILEREVDGALANRMNNEILGNVVYGPKGHPMLVGTPNSPAGKTYPFMHVDDAYIKANTPIADSILSWKLNGETIKHIGDPFTVGLLSLEPAGFMGTTNAFLSISKKWFQSTTTGAFAPFFAPTAGWRGWLQSLPASKDWSRNVGPVGYLGNAVVPRQLTPILEKAWNHQIVSLSNYIQGTALGQLVGTQNVDTVAKALISEMANFRHTFERSGALQKEWHVVENDRRIMINQARSASTNPTYQGLLGYLDRAVQPVHRMWMGDGPYKRAVTGAAEKSWNAYKQYFRDMADAGNTAWAYKNRNTIDPVTGQKIHPAKLAAETRRLTGDPSEKGAHWYKDAMNTVRGMPFYKGDVYSGVVGKSEIAATRGVGAAAQLFRETTPWSGVLVQSPASMASAWINNPLRFGAWFAGTQLLPQMAAYLWNRQLGPEFINYQMEGRTEHARNNRTYVGIPGRKPQDGIEIENYQEGILARRFADVMMDQLFGRSPFTFQEEVWDFLGSVSKTMVVPPMPSTLTAIMSAYGMTAPEGYVGGAFMVKDKGYRDLGRQDNWFERGLRAIAPVVGDMYGQYMTAAHTAQGGTLDQLWAGTKAVSHRIEERTPVVRDILGVHPPTAASTRISEEVRDRQKTIDNLTRFYSKEVANRGMVNTKGKSGAGMDLVRRFAPEIVEEKAAKTPLPGLPQSEIKNPLYTATMKKMEEIYGKDSKGYLSLWSQYGAYTRYIDSLRNVTDENAGLWAEQFKKGAHRYARLQREGVDVNNYRAVRDYYINKRNLASKEILYYMKAGEQAIGKQLKATGAIPPDTNFTLDMLDPYKPGIKPPAP